MSDITTIPIRKATRDDLKKIGHKGETYDDLISRLIELAKHVEFYNQQKKILDEEEFIPLEEF